MKIYRPLLPLIVCLFLWQGCAHKVNVKKSHRFKDKKIKTVYLIENQYSEYIAPRYGIMTTSAPGAYGSNGELRPVKNDLTERTLKAVLDGLAVYGIKVVLGPEQTTYPDNIDAVISYRDKWRWDLKRILDSLEITMISPESRQALAAGIFKIGNTEIHDFPSPEEKVPELMDKLFSSQ